jgi:hypothetical protein
MPLIDAAAMPPLFAAIIADALPLADDYAFAAIDTLMPLFSLHYADYAIAVLCRHYERRHY